MSRSSECVSGAALLGALLLSACGGQGTTVVENAVGAPTLSLTANPASIAAGADTTLSWTSTNASSCTASGSWSGAKPPSGSETIANLTATGNFTLTCSGSGGSASRSVTVTVGAGGTAGRLLMLDEFEYAVARDTDDAGALANLAAFEAAGWSWAKGNNLPNRSGLGYVYTTTTIPGYNGPLPGRNSNRVLVLEGRQGDGAGLFPANQTDFYLQYGQGTVDDAVPASVWYQFWIYIPHTPQQPTWFARRSKFIYPTNCGYPSTCSKWLVGLNAASRYPLDLESGATDPDSPDGEAGKTPFLQVSAEIPAISQALVNGQQVTIGQQSSDVVLSPNRWVLVKMHIDTSGPQGIFRMWMRPSGGSWTQVADYHGGVTPAGFTWPVPQPGGHRQFRIPTTWDGTKNLQRPFNTWVYIDDFAMATSEAALPSYP